MERQNKKKITPKTQKKAPFFLPKKKRTKKKRRLAPKKSTKREKWVEGVVKKEEEEEEDDEKKEEEEEEEEEEENSCTDLTSRLPFWFLLFVFLFLRFRSSRRRFFDPIPSKSINSSIRIRCQKKKIIIKNKEITAGGPYRTNRRTEQKTIETKKKRINEFCFFFVLSLKKWKKRKKNSVKRPFFLFCPVPPGIDKCRKKERKKERKNGINGQMGRLFLDFLDGIVCVCVC